METYSQKTANVRLTTALFNSASDYARAKGKNFSELVRELLCQELGLNASEHLPSPQFGGDLSRFKTKETHKRVCERMRIAKAAKARDEEAPHVNDDDVSRLPTEEERLITRIVRRELRRMRNSGQGKDKEAL